MMRGRPDLRAGPENREDSPDESSFFLHPHIDLSVVLLFKDSSEAALPNRRCSRRDLETLTSRRSEAGLAS